MSIRVPVIYVVCGSCVQQLHSSLEIKLPELFSLLNLENGVSLHTLTRKAPGT